MASHTACPKGNLRKETTVDETRACVKERA
jgi:hypothetical protein